VGRPNELGGQVRPNTLSTLGGRQASLSPAPVSPGWKSPAQTFPTARGTPKPAIARPARLWSLIVFTVIAFNVLRAVTNGLGSSGTSGPTTAPFTAAPVATARAQPTGGIVDPVAGTIEFGVSQRDDCSMSVTGMQFEAGQPIFWWAHFRRPLGPSDRISWSLEHDGAVLDSGDGPVAAPTGTWDSICNTEPVRYFAAGEYTLVVQADSASTETLAKGSYTLLDASPTGSPRSSASTAGSIAFGTNLSTDCRLGGTGFSFAATDKIWWVAQLGAPQAPGAELLWFYRIGSSELGDTVTTPDSDGGKWDRVCAWGPFSHFGPGSYRVEIWTADRSTLLSGGTFHVQP